jgi:hypothetical protein
MAAPVRANTGRLGIRYLNQWGPVAQPINPNADAMIHGLNRRCVITNGKGRRRSRQYG